MTAFFGRGIGLRLGRSNNSLIGETLANDGLEGDVGTVNVVEAQIRAAVIREIKFGGVAVRMLQTAVLIDADHATLVML